MKENLSLTPQWYYQRCCMRLASLCVNMPWRLFLELIDGQLYHTARKLRKKGLITGDPVGLPPVCWNLRLLDNIKYPDIALFVQSMIVLLDDIYWETRHILPYTPAEQLKYMRCLRKDFDPGGIDHEDAQLLTQVDALLRFSSSGEITPLQEAEIRRLYSPFMKIHRKSFGNMRKNCLLRFHETQGYAIAATLGGILDSKTLNLLPTELQIHACQALSDYWDLHFCYCTSYAAPIKALHYGQLALKCMEKYGASDEDLGYQWLTLSELFLACYKEIMDIAEEKSNEALTKAQYYFDRSIPEKSMLQLL